MGLQLIASVHLVTNLISERVVDFVPVEQRQIGGLLQQVLDAIAHVARRVTLALRSLNVVVAEPRPRLRHRVAANHNQSINKSIGKQRNKSVSKSMNE